MTGTENMSNHLAATLFVDVLEGTNNEGLNKGP
jgi:hypothetical protein